MKLKEGMYDKHEPLVTNLTIFLVDHIRYIYHLDR